MKILILGGDGYLGWPTAMHFAHKGHDVYVVDNYSRRKIAKKYNSEALFKNPTLEKRIQTFQNNFKKKIFFEIFDCSNYQTKMLARRFKPTIIHYEQPQLPFNDR